MNSKESKESEETKLTRVHHEMFDYLLVDKSVIIPHELVVLQPWHPIFKLAPTKSKMIIT